MSLVLYLVVEHRPNLQWSSLSLSHVHETVYALYCAYTEASHLELKGVLDGVDLIEDHRHGEQKRDDGKTAENGGDAGGQRDGHLLGYA